MNRLLSFSMLKPSALRVPILISSIVILFSCGGGSSGDTSPPNATPAPTTPAPVPTPTPEVDAAAEFTTLIADMDMPQLLTQGWRALSLRDPQTVLGLGLADDYQLQGVELTPIDFPYQRATIAMWQALLDKLQTLDTSGFSTTNMVDFNTLTWLAQRNAELADFLYYDFQATYFGTSVPRSTQRFFSDLHPMESESDVNDYLTRLALVDDKIDQLIVNLQEMEANGVVEPAFTLEFAIGVHAGAVSDTLNSPYYVNFSDKLNGIEELDGAQREQYRQTARNTIANIVRPSYDRLNSFLTSQLSRAPQQIGVGQYPNGGAWYQQRLRYHTTTDLTAQQIHDLGLQELERIHAELRVRFDERGYPQDETMQQLFSRVASDGGFVQPANILSTYEQLVDDAEVRMEAIFNRFPVQQVRIVGGPTGGFYVRGSLDGTRDGAFFAQNVNSEPYFTMPTLAYHEAMPGHHMQIALAQETNLADFRRNYPATGYIEGWGLYAERLAGEYDWYADDIYGDIGRLNFEALRAARLVVDTGIHVLGWNLEQAVAFFQDNVGVSSNSAFGNIARYSVYTGQATAYMTGMLKIIELRERMRTAQGDAFDIKAYHDLVLDNGAMPLTVLEDIIDQAIASE